MTPPIVSGGLLHQLYPKGLFIRRTVSWGCFINWGPSSQKTLSMWSWHKTNQHTPPYFLSFPHPTKTNLSSPNIPGYIFCYWSKVDWPRIMLQEEPDFGPSRRQEMPIAPQIGMKFLIHLSAHLSPLHSGICCICSHVLMNTFR